MEYKDGQETGNILDDLDGFGRLHGVLRTLKVATSMPISLLLVEGMLASLTLLRNKPLDFSVSPSTNTVAALGPEAFT